jgi:hypothetical protein
VNKTGLPGSAEPWGRDVEKRIGKLERRTGLMSGVLDDFQHSRADKSVFAEYNYGMNLANGASGKVALDFPVLVQYVTSTGLFEVTVSLAGLVMGGSTLGLSFESDEYPSDVYFDMPKYGVSGSCAASESRYIPLTGSRSTVISARPGIYDLSLYAWVNNTASASAQAYIHRAQLSVKAV